MSIAQAANLVRAQGRNGDTQLIHMTPGEVGGLQALAQNYGGSLTVNPETGLPEANFLKAILPALIGVGITAATGGAAAPWMIGAGVGGFEALRTGDLSKGLLAGLGAFGGAGLGGAVSSLGAASPTAAASAMGVPGAATGAGSQAAMLASQNAGFGAEGLSHLAGSAGGTAPSGFSLFGEGLKQAAGAPGAFLKGNLLNLGMAAAPALAGGFDQGKMPSGAQPQPQPSNYAGPYRPMERQVQFPSDPRTLTSEFNYFTPSNPNPGFEPFAQGGLAALAAGGELLEDGSFVVDARTVAELGNGSSNAGMELLMQLGGRPVQGPGDGVSDSIPATIEGEQDAAVARDEVIFDSEAVARIGGGDPEAGAQRLYSLMRKAEEARKEADRGEDSGVAAGLGTLAPMGA